MVEYKHEKQKATKFTLKVKGDTQEYALSLLHIINNAREFPNMIYKVENTYNDIVYVTCRPKYAENIKEYLEQFGEIKSEDTINWFVVSAQYDSAGWNELFGEDCEQDFTVEIE